MFLPVLLIRNFFLDPELLFRIRIQQNMKEQIKNNYRVTADFRPVNSGLCVFCMTTGIVKNRKWQIVGKFFFYIEF